MTRGGTKGAADLAFFRQLGRYPGALGTVAVLMALFALVPGLPFVPFMLGAAGLGGLAALTRRRARVLAEPPPVVPDLPQSKRLGDVLDFDEIHVEFSPSLVAMVLDRATGLDVRIANMRTHIATAFGLILPEIRLTDGSAAAARQLPHPPAGRRTRP